LRVPLSPGDHADGGLVRELSPGGDADRVSSGTLSPGDHAEGGLVRELSPGGDADRVSSGTLCIESSTDSMHSE
jgi:hypothetical protein